MRSQLAQMALATAHLALMGVLGPAAIIILLVLIGVGAPMVVIAGLGLIMLALAAGLLRGISLFEHHRVAGLFRTGQTPPPARRSTRTDWLRGPATAALQYVDPGNLKALLHVLVISLLGAVALWVLKLIGTGLAMPLAPLYSPDQPLRLSVWGDLSQIEVSPGWAIPLGLAAVVLGVAVLAGLAIAHRAVSVQLLIGSHEDELAAQAAAATQRRDEAMRAAEVERVRIERDLHDGVQPRLVSVGMTLGMARSKLASDPEAAAALIDEAHTSTKSAITELRQLARGIHPAVLDDRGLDAALSALVARSHVPVQLTVQLSHRYPKNVEAAMYFAVAESLTNIAKHSEAGSGTVIVSERPGGRLWARISDDGAGGARRVAGGGLDGVANRVSAAGGTFSLNSPPGGPTAIEVSLPCES